jgi:hypothetical protein
VTVQMALSYQQTSNGYRNHLNDHWNFQQTVCLCLLLIIIHCTLVPIGRMDKGMNPVSHFHKFHQIGTAGDPQPKDQRITNITPTSALLH